MARTIFKIWTQLLYPIPWNSYLLPKKKKQKQKKNKKKLNINFEP